jgi:3-dehydroquinate synthase
VNRRIEVALGGHSYPIDIGPGLLARTETFSQCRERDILVVSNEIVAPLYQSALTRSLRALPATRVEPLILPDGEAAKTLVTAGKVFDRLLELGFHRDCLLIALGGGVTGDLTGFTAACYQRGVDFIQVPTTLLAQVDASVGGKTGVNHALGKNMIGAFHQPVAVVADTETLHTLPGRELRAGAAEVIKTALLGDAALFEQLEQDVDRLLSLDAEVTSQTIARCCEIKAGIVARDERETGERALLNLGHTFGHAIETALGHGQWLHGEAVAAGLVMAAGLAARVGLCEPQLADRIRTLVSRTGLPVDPPTGLDADRMLSLMRQDKKTLAGRLRLVLPERPGRARVVEDLDERAVLEWLRSVTAS